jgi:hypothetical protein
MAETPKAPRRQSKRDLAEALLKRLDQWQRDGATPEEALEKLTVKQYDFLIDYGVNLDNLIMTDEQQKAIAEVRKAGRPKGLTYTKKYPQSKQDLFNSILELIQEQGGVVEPREKINYRDLDFEMCGVKYKIVLSQPRPPKN